MDTRWGKTHESELHERKYNYIYIRIKNGRYMTWSSVTIPPLPSVDLLLHLTYLNH